MVFEHIKSRLTSLNWENFIMVASTFATFFLAAIVSHLYQYYRNHGTLSFVEFLKLCFPVRGWKSKSSMIDVFMYFANKFIAGLVGIGDALITLFLATAVANLLTRLFPGHRQLHAGFITLILWSFVLFLAVDFANFLTHYWQHKVPFLWELHKVHHSATFLSPLTTARMHPLGNKFDSLGQSLLLVLPAGTVMFLYGLSMPDIFVMNANANMIGTILVLDTLRHSQFPVSFGRLDRVLMSPHMHHLHHSVKYEHWDRNMGNKLSIWDWIFGTATIPAKDETLVYGIGRGIQVDQQFESLHGVYIRPVIEMVRVMCGHRPVLGHEPPVASTSGPAAAPAQSLASQADHLDPDSESEGLPSPV